MERFVFSYIFCGFLCGIIVTATELREKTNRGQYVLGAFLLPSVVYGNWRYALQANHPDAHSKGYMQLTWMSRIHLLLLLASIFIPFEFISDWIFELIEPGIQNNGSFGGMGIELALEGGLMLIGGMMSIIEMLIWIIVYMVLAFVLVAIPRMARPAY